MRFPMKSESIANNKELAKQFFQVAFIDYDVERTLTLITDEYVQHNPMVPSGAEPFVQILPILKEQDMKFTNRRLIADEEYVVSHNVVGNVPITGFQNVVTFDVWRVEDGKLAEHWDNVTEHLATTNPAGRSQFDGAIDIADYDKTSENKTFVLDFVETVLIGEDYSKMSDYVSVSVEQHNTNTGDGIEAWIAASDSTKTGYDKVHLSVAEGNFVFTMSEGTVGDKPTSIYNLFRLADGKIVEHWDIFEEIPTEWAHGNGKF